MREEAVGRVRLHYCRKEKGLCVCVCKGETERERETTEGDGKLNYASGIIKTTSTYRFFFKKKKCESLTV